VLQTVDGRNLRGLGHRSDREEEYYRRSKHVDGGGQFNWRKIDIVDVENIARDIFTRIDNIHNDVLNEGIHVPEDVNMEMLEDGDDMNVENLLQEFRERVFDDSSVNRLQCCIIIYSLCTLYSIPHTFVDALLTWSAGDLLPTSNCFLRTSYELKSILMKFGLHHK